MCIVQAEVQAEKTGDQVGEQGNRVTLAGGRERSPVTETSGGYRSLWNSDRPQRSLEKPGEAWGQALTEAYRTPVSPVNVPGTVLLFLKTIPPFPFPGKRRAPWLLAVKSHSAELHSSHSESRGSIREEAVMMRLV